MTHQQFFFSLPLHSFYNSLTICNIPSICLPFITTLLVALLFLLSSLPCFAHMALETSGFSNMAIPDGRTLTGDLLCTPNTTQSYVFNQNASLLLDRTRDIHTSSDSSPLVCDSTICFTESYDCFFPYRTCCRLPWSSDSAASQQTNYYPAATAHICKRSLQSNGCNGESEKWKTKTESSRKDL